MIDTIVIDFTNPSSSIPWAIFFEGEQRDAGHVSALSELVELARNQKIVVWVSGQQVLHTSVSVPAGQQRHLHKIVPSLLEDELASDIDTLHFSVGHVGAHGEASVAVIDRDVIDSLLDQFKSVGLMPQILLPDSLAIPFRGDDWTLQIEGSIGRMRTAKQVGYVFDMDNLDFLAKLKTENESQLIKLFSETDESEALKPYFNAIWQGNALETRACLPDAEASAINLLQGEFKPQSHFFKYWKQWRNVVYIALVGLFLQLVSVALDTWQLNQQASAYKAQVKQTYLSAFPAEKRLVNARAQMTQHLTALQNRQNGAGFLRLLQKISATLQPFNSIGYSRISYEKQLGELKLDVKTKDYTQLQALKDAIAKQGLSVELGSVSGNEGNYVARLLIKEQQ